MAHWDEIFDDSNNDLNEQRKKVCEDRIEEVQNFLKKYNARQWSVVSVEFGEQLFKDKHFNYHSMDREYSILKIKEMKGLNYGTYELSYFHHAIILRPFELDDIRRTKTITVIPIQTNHRKKSFKILSKYNRFLEKDSHLLLDSVTTIGMERINIGKTKNMAHGNRLSELNPRDLIEVKKQLKTILGLG